MEETIGNIAQFFSGNGQNIREHLLRMACKHCDHYATDICILLSERGLTLNKFFMGDSGNLVIGFRDYGVDWDDELLKTEYRYMCVLTRKGSLVTLEDYTK